MPHLVGNVRDALQRMAQAPHRAITASQQTVRGALPLGILPRPQSAHAMRFNASRQRANFDRSTSLSHLVNSARDAITRALHGARPSGQLRCSRAAPGALSHGIT